MRDRSITVFGRQAVREALEDDRLSVERVVVADSARGDHVEDIVALARRRGISLRRRPAAEVTRLSRHGRQDQGVVAEVRAPGLGELEEWVAGRPDGAAQLFLLDGLTTPANVGLIVRSVAAAGLDGVVLPRRGCADVGPLVVKASAGTAFRSTMLRCQTPAGGARTLAAAGFTVVGLRARDADSLYEVECPARAVWVVGSESDGVRPGVAVDRWVGLPLARGIESINAAAAATVVAYELVRRGLGAGAERGPSKGGRR